MAVTSTVSPAEAPKASELTLGIAGLTSAGVIAAAVAARKGARVVAFDDDIACTAALRRGESPVREPALAPLIENSRDKIDYTATAADLSQCGLIYIFVDAAADEKGQPDVSALKTFLRDISAAARPEAILVLVGRVPPGFARSYAPKGRSVFYQVQAPGLQPEAMLRPDWVMVGCADPSVPMPAVLAAYLASFDCPVMTTRYESAELAGVAIDMVVASSAAITTALSELCEKVGADWAEIMPAIKMDRRIAEPSYAPTLADDHLERALAEAAKLATAHSLEGGPFEAFLAGRRRRRDWVLQRLEKHVLAKTPDARLALFGLDDAAAGLLGALPKLKVRAYDPGATAETDRPGSAEIVGDPLEACAQADALVILVPAPSFPVPDPAAIAERMRGKTVIDPYRVLDPVAAARAGLSHHVLGRAP